MHDLLSALRPHIPEVALHAALDELRRQKLLSAEPEAQVPAEGEGQVLQPPAEP